MFLFGEFRDPYGPFGNKPEVPTDDTDVHGGECDPLEDGCISIITILIGIMLLIVLSFIFS